MSTNIVPEFKAHFILRGKIQCQTGLHIGGSKEKLEIGGVDSIVVRSPRTDLPYIPGSSLKGKMRFLLEYVLGAVGDPVIVKKENGWSEERKREENIGNVSKAPDIVRLFGIGADDRDGDALKNIGLTRLVVRDAFPDEATVEMWGDLGSDANFTEYKAENTIDRLTSAANPRFIERVVEGSSFNFEIVYTLYAMPNEENYLENGNRDLQHLLTALRLLEGSALGKSGSRGYGKIAFHLAKPDYLTQTDYQVGSPKWRVSKEVSQELKSLHDLPADWFTIPQ